ncbi:MAG: hypothetical protein DCC71_15550 [Proteobacteria bacterium]|nr:MAG: hypothetical protein DCC71_15550 [Pseudomonadota bacterium]
MIRALVVAAVVVAAAAVLWMATLSHVGFECEACVRWEGREACKRATGIDRTEAERAAITVACAQVASGVTAAVGCQGLPPLSLTCTER